MRRRRLRARPRLTRRIHVARPIDLEQSASNARAFNAHTQLLDLLQARQLETALQALREHIDLSLKRAVQIPQEMVAKFCWAALPAPQAGLPIGRLLRI